VRGSTRKGVSAVSNATTSREPHATPAAARDAWKPHVLACAFMGSFGYRTWTQTEAWPRRLSGRWRSTCASSGQSSSAARAIRSLSARCAGGRLATDNRRYRPRDGRRVRPPPTVR
jgi:hypothetical protein